MKFIFKLLYSLGYNKRVYLLIYRFDLEIANWDFKICIVLPPLLDVNIKYGCEDLKFPRNNVFKIFFHRKVVLYFDP